MTLNENVIFRAGTPHRYKLAWIIRNSNPSPTISSLFRGYIDKLYDEMNGPPLPPELTDESEIAEDEFPI